MIDEAYLHLGQRWEERYIDMWMRLFDFVDFAASFSAPFITIARFHVISPVVNRRTFLGHCRPLYYYQ